MDQDSDYIGSFTRPTIGAKVYLSRGPSGLPETFDRKTADRELEIYLGRVKIKIAVDSFIRQMLIARRPENWGDVIEHLAKLTKLEADLVPLDVGVAFWAQVDQSREAAARAKQLAKGN
jgi:hypothetical protein